jgi:hypothetical protein
MPWSLSLSGFLS